MNYSLDGKTFKALSNSENGEVDAGTVFTYHQQGRTVWAEYSGGQILRGSILGKFIGEELHMNYHHLSQDGELKAGTCRSTISQLADGRLQISERWQWYSGDQSSGESELIEQV